MEVGTVLGLVGCGVPRMEYGGAALREARWKHHRPCLQGTPVQVGKKLSTGQESDGSMCAKASLCWAQACHPQPLLPTSSGPLWHLVHFALRTPSP